MFSRFALASAFTLSLFSFSAAADVAYVPQGAPRPYEVEVAPQRVLDRDTVRSALLAQRKLNVAEFRAYERAGVFPDNLTGETRNVWRDANGHLCAAANLISKSGSDELAQRVADQNNFIRLKDVSTGPVMDWMLTSGFTQDEIVMIQLPYMPVEQPARPNRVERSKREAENRRLHSNYKTIAAKLDRQQRASLELAVTRLMKRPELAWSLIDNASVAPDAPEAPEGTHFAKPPA